MSEVSDLMDRLLIDKMLRTSRLVAHALADAGIPPSNESTAAMIALAAANSQHSRKPPMTRERFVRLAGDLYDIAAKSAYVMGPTVPAENSENRSDEEDEP